MRSSLALALPFLAAAPAQAQLCQPFWANAGATLPGYPLSVALFGDSNRPELFCTVEFMTVHVYRWDGARWANVDGSLPTAPSRFLDVRVFDDGSGPALYVLGLLQGGPTGTTNFARRWNGTDWIDTSPGFVPSNASAYPYTSLDAGDGMRIYGRIRQVGTSHWWAARWTGSEWVAISPDLFTQQFTFTVYNDGSGPRLYMLGTFLNISGVRMDGFARWLGGTNWERPPSNHQYMGQMRDVAVLDFGSGPAIYAYGDQIYINNALDPINGLGRWDGQTWVNLGGPNLGPGEVYGRTRMKVFDDGTGGGPAIYVTGGFNDWGGANAHGIAKWDGQSWSSVIRGILPGSEVNDMAAGIGPHGPAL